MAFELTTFVGINELWVTNKTDYQLVIFSNLKINYYVTLHSHLYNSCYYCRNFWLWWYCRWSCKYCKSFILYLFSVIYYFTNYRKKKSIIFFFSGSKVQSCKGTKVQNESIFFATLNLCSFATFSNYKKKKKIFFRVQITSLCTSEPSPLIPLCVVFFCYKSDWHSDTYNNYQYRKQKRKI